MGTKSEELELLSNGEGCLGKAADDEPLFILRSTDRFAPKLVEAWIELVEDANDGKPTKKTEEARRLMEQMIGYQMAHGAKVPD